MRKQQAQRGIASVLFAILLLGIIGFAAMALDIGLLYSQRTQLQRAADAGALAGAFTFVTDAFAADPKALARAQAMAAVTNNLVDNTALTAADVTPPVDVDVANQRVTVSLAHPENTFLARAFGINSLTIHVVAVAEASQRATGAACAKPWFIPNTIMDQANAPCTACSLGNVLIQGGQATSYALNLIQSGNNEFTIKPQSPSSAIAPGQFFAIQFGGSSGANDYRDNITFCQPVTKSCLASYSVETGDMSGPTIQGAQDLIGWPKQDKYLSGAQCPAGLEFCYQSSTGTISDISRALVVAPIWDTCTYAGFCPGNTLPSGTKVTLQVLGFAILFIENAQGGNVTARLINVKACDPVTPPTNAPLAVLVRLVRMN